MSSNNKKHVLYIEDDAALAFLFKKQLDASLYQVDIAHDGSTGLLMCESKAYDIIFVDQNLPTLSGLEVLEILKKKLQIDIPVIIVTVDGNENLISQSFALDAFDYILKDVAGTYLRLLPLTIEKALTQYNLIQQKIKSETNAQLASQRFQTLVEHISDIITVVNLNGIIQYMSPSGYKFFGVSSLDDFDSEIAYIDPDDMARLTGLYETISRTPGQSVPINCRLRHHSGDWRWFEGTAINLLRDKAVQGIVVNLHDVTSLHESQQKFEQERNTLRTIMDVIPDRISVKDRQGKVILRNQKSRELHDKTDDFTDLTRWIQLSHKLDLRVIETNSPVMGVEEQIGDQWFLINKIPLHATNGDVTGVVGIRRDITEHKQHEQDMLRHNKQLLGLQVASSKVTSSLELEEIMQALGEEITRIAGYQYCSFSSWNKEDNILENTVIYDSESQTTRISDKIYRVDEYPATAEVLTTWNSHQKTISQPDIDPAEYAHMQADGIKSVVIVPIIYGNTSIGLAEIEDRHEEKTLNSNQLMTVELLLHQAGIAFQNAYLYTQAQNEIAERERVEKALKASEEKLHSTLASLDDLVFTFDTNNIFLDYYQPERPDAKLYMPPKVFIGKDYHDILPPIVTMKMDDAITRLKATGEVQQIEYPMEKDGEEYWFSAKISLRYGDAKEAVGYTVIARDITQMIQAQQEIENKAQQIARSSRRYQALFDQSNDAIFIIARDWTLEMANPRASELFGYSVVEFQQLSVFDLFPADEDFDNLDFWQYLRKDEKLSIYERNFQRKNGSIFPGEYLIEIVRDDDGQFLHIQSIVRDITERKQFEESMLTQQRRLQALHQMATAPATTIDAMLEGALALAVDLLGMDAGIISQINGNEYQITYAHIPGAIDFKTGDILRLDQTFCDFVYKKQETTTINYASKHDQYSIHPCYQQLGIESFIGEPVVIQNTVYGTLNFISQSPKVPGFDETDKSFLRLMAQWVSTVLERDRVETTLRGSEERFRVMFEMAPNGIFLMTLDGIIRRANSAFVNLLGYTQDNLIGQDIDVVLHPDDTLDSIMEHNVQQKPMYHLEQRLMNNDGEIVHVLLRATWLHTTLQEPFYLMGQVIDITERKLAEQELAEYVEQLELLHQIESELTQTLNVDAVYRLTVDTALRFSGADYGYIAIHQNERLEITHYLGTPDEQMNGYILPEKSISMRVFRQQQGELISNVSDDEDYVSSWQDAKSQITLPLTSAGRKIGILGLECNNNHFTEEIFDFLTLVSNRVASAIDNALLFAKTQDQLHRLTELHDKLLYQATHDPLTRLPNRALFEERLAGAISSARLQGLKIALLYIDLDGFKRINDTLGHPVGDQVLVEVSNRLRNCIRQQDTVARMGGDEFTIIIPLHSSENIAYNVANRVLGSIREPFMLVNEVHFISASIGMSFYPEDGIDGKELMRKADTALYVSKDSGKNTVNTYDTVANRKVIESVILGNLLHKAIEKDELELYYQPQVCLKTGKILRAEALIRWDSEEMGFIAPGKFLPIANEVGMLVPISNWVFEQACKQQDKWWQNGHRLTVSVNIAIPQFQQDEFTNLILDIANRYDFPNSSIELEVTEQLMMNNLDEAAEKISTLRDAGFKIALDDFGTGYSSLSYLQKLPIDTIKIDRSLVMDIGGETELSKKSLAIITAICSLASTLDIEIVAEGMETVTQRQNLGTLGIHLGQGFLISEALAPDDFMSWLKAYSETISI